MKALDVEPAEYDYFKVSRRARAFGERRQRQIRAEALQPILDQCDAWDVLSKGESPTTKRLRQIVRDVLG